MVSSTVGELGQLNVMVANAGICRGKALLDTEVEDWDKMFSVNGRGIFLCYKYAAKQMIKQGKGGRLIGASSVAGRRGEPGLGSLQFNQICRSRINPSSIARVGVS